MEILAGPRDGRSGTPKRDACAMPGRTEDRRAGFQGGEPGGQRSSRTDRAGRRMKRGFRAALVGVLGLVVPLAGYTAELTGRVESISYDRCQRERERVSPTQGAPDQSVAGPRVNS